MARSGRPGDADADGERSDPVPVSLARRTRARTQVRAALALEEAGELHDAARLFEYAGEHAQAASLRLEHANTLADERQRLSVLREGAARNAGDTEQGRQLHTALARALQNHAAALGPGPHRRALLMEAAQALEEADDGEAAGELYEQLGLLHDAARAFEHAGAITRLELVLAILERREQVERALEATQREVEWAHRAGRRRLAREMLLDHVATRSKAGLAPRVALARMLAAIEETMIRRRRFVLESGGSERARVRVIGTPTLRIGRAPEVEVVLPGAALSRVHAELRIDTTRGQPRLVVVDLGSRAGTFFDGIPLEPAVEFTIDASGELALGLGASLEVVPVGEPEAPAALLRSGRGPWTLFLPLGGRAQLSPDQPLPFSVRFDEPHVAVEFDPAVFVDLDGEPLGDGASLELLVDDHLHVRSPDIDIELVVHELSEVGP